MKFAKWNVKFQHSTISLTILQYKIYRKMKMLQEYWASTVVFIGILSQCGYIKFQFFLHCTPRKRIEKSRK